MKKVYILIITISVFGCKTSHKISSTKVTKRKHVHSTIEPTQANQTIKSLDKIPYVDLLKKFSDSDDYFVALAFKENIPYENTFHLLQKTATDTIFSSELELRKKLEKNNVQKYMHTDELNELLVFNKDQNIIDTVYFTNFEFYDTSIESFFLASFNADSKSLNNHVIISHSTIKLSKYRKSPTFHPDPSVTSGLSKSIRENIFSAQSLIYNGDTISILSYSNYPQLNSAIYLLNNGIATDSIMNEFIIMDMIPVPLASDKEIVYLSKSGIPHSDDIWNTLIGIELDSMKFKTYDYNRFHQ